jgi:glycosyltransferase involved in cell wall biosynthesis
VLLWFTHWKRTRTLEAAVHLSSAIASVDRRSVPVESEKVIAIGHGIDLDEFPCRERRREDGDFRVVALGRYSRAKGLPTVLEAVRLVLDGGLDLRLEVFGPALNSAEREHRGALERVVADLGLERRVRLGHALLRSEVPDLFARADALVNNMEAGAPDKVVYEAAASCLPVLASNPVFDELVQGLAPTLLFARDDPEGLAGRLAELAALAPAARASLGRVLRERVAARHSVGSWAQGMLKAAER